MFIADFVSGRVHGYFLSDFWIEICNITRSERSLVCEIIGVNRNNRPNNCFITNIFQQTYNRSFRSHLVNLVIMLLLQLL